MRKYLSVFLIFISVLLLFAHPASAKTIGLDSEKRLADLANRFASLESNWGRFQIGGNLSLESNSYLDNLSEEQLPTFNFGQHLGLYLDAYVEHNLMLSLKMSHHGGWGLNFQSAYSPNYPMTTPVEIDEAFIRLEYPTNLNYLGRFRFSISPVGLISDFYNNPVEGLALQKSFANQYHLIGIYSRFNTEYYPGTDRVATSEDYFAARFGWSDQNTVFGMNLVPNGITGEKGISFDASFTEKNAKLSAELAWYSFESPEDPKYDVDWTPGFLVSYGRSLTKDAHLQVKAAYLSTKFQPSYSSLAHRSGTNREWFWPNSKGVELLLQNRLGTTFSLENRLIALAPVQNFNQPELTYHWRGSVIKSFSPVNQLELGIDHNRSFESTLSQAYLRWNLSF